MAAKRSGIALKIVLFFVAVMVILFTVAFIQVVYESFTADDEPAAAVEEVEPVEEREEPGEELPVEANGDDPLLADEDINISDLESPEAEYYKTINMLLRSYFDTYLRLPETARADLRLAYNQIAELRDTADKARIMDVPDPFKKGHLEVLTAFDMIEDVLDVYSHAIEIEDLSIASGGEDMIDIASEHLVEGVFMIDEVMNELYPGTGNVTTINILSVIGDVTGGQ